MAVLRCLSKAAVFAICVKKHVFPVRGGANIIVIIVSTFFLKVYFQFSVTRTEANRGTVLAIPL